MDHKQILHKAFVAINLWDCRIYTAQPSYPDIILVKSIQIDDFILMEKQLLTQFDLHQRLFNNVLDGFKDGETNRRLHGDNNINHVKYLAGHLLNSQYGLAISAGLQTEVKWNDLFAVMGQSVARDDIKYPTIEEIRSEWNRLYEPLRSNLKQLNEEELAATPAEPFDQVADSIHELWTFINHHIAYHIGQIGILRKGFGKEPMSYGPSS